jgi:RNA polymerase sigma-70 factor (ECF subfamily)
MRDLALSIHRVTDSELVERARAGDAAAFGELMTRHVHAVYRTALAALGSAADADDVTQESFVRAHRQLTTFRGDASFRTWVAAIAWRRALNRRRSLVRRVRLFVQPAESPSGEPVAPGLSAEATLIAAERQRVVVRLIRALPSRLRDPLLMAASDEHTYSEMAAILGIPEGTLKWRVSEARRLVKRKLEGLGYTTPMAQWPFAR